LLALPQTDDDSAKTAACYRFEKFLVFMHEMTKNLKLIERSVAKVVRRIDASADASGADAAAAATGSAVHSKLLIKLTLGVDLHDAL